MQIVNILIIFILPFPHIYPHPSALFRPFDSFLVKQEISNLAAKHASPTKFSLQAHKAIP